MTHIMLLLDAVILQSWGFSPESSFTAAPPVGPDTTVKILAVADMGQGELDGSMEQAEMQMSLRTTARMLSDVQDKGFQLLVHNGDISYARGYVTQVRYRMCCWCMWCVGRIIYGSCVVNPPTSS